MPVFVGVDAGGSATRVVAMRDEQMLGSSVEGAAQVRTQGVDAAANTIVSAIEAALGSARPDAVCIGAAGAGHDNTASALQKAVESRVAGARVAVTDDAHIALRAAIPQGDGVVLISGTGSIAYAQVEGKTYRAGGYGYLLGDEGSGAALGAAALRHYLRFCDHRIPSDGLVDAVQRELGATTTADAIDRIYSGANAVHAISAFAGYAPLVLELAGKGDRAATKIVQAAALELFDLVKTIVKASNSSSRELTLAFSGGLLASNSLLTYLVETRIGNEFPNLAVEKNSPKPEYGAVVLAKALV